MPVPTRCAQACLTPLIGGDTKREPVEHQRGNRVGEAPVQEPSSAGNTNVMLQYVLRRVLALLPVLFVASSVIFCTLRLFAPISIVEQKLAESPGARDPIVRQRLEEEFGLDKPVHVQYVTWLWGAVRGDLGTSWSTGRPAVQQIVQALPVTLELALLAMVIAAAVGIPLGVFSAIHQNRMGDYLARFGVIIGLSVPNFVVATVLLLLPAMAWGWAPPLGYVPFWEDPGKHLVQMFLPLISLALAVSAAGVRILRSSMLEVIRLDFVRTARAKGLNDRQVVYRHALQNALIPAVTVLGLQLSITLGGSVVVEQIYALPGLGRLTLDAIQRGDFPQLQANVLYLLVIYLLVNLLVDLSYGWLDPRIRYR
jgi:peptide/nickel transport system permease protein